MTPREIRFAIDGLSAMVIVSVAGALAIFTWRIAGEARGVSPVEATIMSHAPAAPPPDISSILNQPPFGRAAVIAEGPADAASLILQGTLLANPGWASSALIQAEGLPAAMFRIGEALPTGAILERIDIDYVVIRAGERLFALYFPGDERAGGAPASEIAAAGQPTGSSPTPANQVGIEAVRALVPPNVSGLPAAQAPAAAPSGATSQSLIDSIGATATPQGYQVGPNPAQQMRAAGLRPGDIVATVNGVEPNRFIGDPQMTGEAVATGQVRVVVLRDGSRVTLSLPLR